MGSRFVQVVLVVAEMASRAMSSTRSPATVGVAKSDVQFRVSASVDRVLESMTIDDEPACP